MLRFSLVGMSALVAVVLMGSMASAATISEVLAGTGRFDPTQQYYLNFQIGTEFRSLDWSTIQPNGLFDPTGHRTGTYTTDPAANPTWLDFRVGDSSNGGGGGTGGGGTTPTQFQHSFTLARTDHLAATMDFSMLFYDPSFTGTGLLVELTGSEAGPATYKTATLSKEDVNAGMMLTWTLVTGVDETVLVRTTAQGADTGADGFFINSNLPTAPEPATLAFLLVGAGGVLVRRMRKH
jgi:hypothetical protein